MGHNEKIIDLLRELSSIIDLDDKLIIDKLHQKYIENQKEYDLLMMSPYKPTKKELGMCVSTFKKFLSASDVGEIEFDYKHLKSDYFSDITKRYCLLKRYYPYPINYHNRPFEKDKNAKLRREALSIIRTEFLTLVSNFKTKQHATS